MRTWSVTRFRGMISTQPGSTPMASFKVVSLEEFDPHQCYVAGNDFGRFYVKALWQKFAKMAMYCPYISFCSFARL